MSELEERLDFTERIVAKSGSPTGSTDRRAGRVNPSEAIAFSAFAFVLVKVLGPIAAAIGDRIREAAPGAGPPAGRGSRRDADPIGRGGRAIRFCRAASRARRRGGTDSEGEPSR